MPQLLVGIARLAHSAPLIEAKRVVSYSQLPTFELLNRCSSPRMPFEWTINPYRGCEFACKYCYARYTHEFMEFHDPFEFENRIFAKQWNPAAFRQKLRKIDRRESIALGTATDPYQPAERRYNLTRSILEVFASMPGYRLSITTKSDLIARDVDVLAAIAKHSDLSVNMTLTTVDVELARKLEPRAPRPDLRLEAMRTLTAAGISCGTLCCPVMPLINDKESQLNAVAEATRAAGAAWFVANPLFLTNQPKQVFFDFIRNEFPHLTAKYCQAFARTAYLRDTYKQKIRDRVHAIRARHGFGARGGAWDEKELVEPQMMLPLEASEAS